MNWLDVLILIFMILMIITGLRRGLIKTVIPMIGIILAIALAGQFYDSVGSWLSHWLKSENQANIVGFAIIFILVLIVALLVASILNKLFSMILLGWIDKLGGAFLGFIIGSLICGAILTLMTKYHFPGIEGSIHDSSLASFFVDHFPIVLPLLPKEFDTVRDFFG